MSIYKFNFIKSELEALKTYQTQYEVRDIKTDGLTLRVNSGGTKTFIFWKRINGRDYKIKIGNFPDVSIEHARKRADKLRADLSSDNSIQPLLRSKVKFRELYDRYYKEYSVIHTKRPDDNKAQLEYHILPRIGDWYLSSVTKDEMKKIHLEIGTKRGQTQSNRMINMVSAIFNFGIREQIYAGINPCQGIKRFKLKSRDRFLTPEELGKFFEALDFEETIYKDYFTLCILIGARKTNMLRMRYDELDLFLNCWKLEADQSKNDDVNIYVLSSEAVEILKRRKAANESSIAPSEYVFPGDGKGGHLADPKKAFARVKERMGVADLRIHDLRRTLASYMAITNASLPIIAQALNHKSIASTEIYARLSLDPVHSAVANATSVILNQKNRIDANNCAIAA